MLKITNPVNLIILNTQNQVLLAKRNEDEIDKGKWSIPGGCVENNESFEETLHREIKEELNCKITKYDYFKSYSFQVSNNFIARAVYFYGEINGQIQLNDELSEYQRFDLNVEKIKELDLAFNQEEVLMDFVKFIKR